MFPPGIEPGTFRVLGGCDNHYTTETLDIIVINVEFGRNCKKLHSKINLTKDGVSLKSK